MKRKLLVYFIPLLYLLILLFQKDLALTEDLGRHIKLGEVILNCRCVPQVNLFSFTDPNFPWINNSWLSQVTFYFLYKTFGLEGLLWLKIILIITSFLILYSIVVKKTLKFWAVSFALVMITVFSVRFRIRPELFSYVFISLFIYLIYKYRQTKKTVFLYALPVLELLWVNFHIYFIFGIIIYSFFAIEEFILRKRTIERSILLIFVLLIVSTLINPNFIKGALLPFTIFTNYNYVVEENQTPFSFLSSGMISRLSSMFLLQLIVFEISLLVSVAALISNFKKKSILNFLLILFSGVLAIKMLRAVPLYAMLTFIPISKTLSSIDNVVKKYFDYTALNIIKTVVILSLLLMVFFHIKGIKSYNLFGLSYLPSAEKAIDFYINNKIRGPVFNDFNFGAYLIFRLYPSEKVFVDGRAEAYSGEFLSTYGKMVSNMDFFENKAAQYHINSVIFTTDWHTRSFPAQLLENKNWIPVYLDDWMIIFVKNNKENKDIIEKYGIKQKIRVVL